MQKSLVIIIGRLSLLRNYSNELKNVQYILKDTLLC